MQAGRRTILVVDDAPENIDLLVGLLKQRFTVKAARSGPVALKICHSPAPPDLVLMDIVMPEMDGYEACRRLKGDPATAAIPVIFLSGEKEVRAGECGAAGWLSKPVDAERLLAAIDSALAAQG